MKKFFQIFTISFQQEFAYRLSFILWRFRNVLQILIFFFLWDAVFSSGNDQLFGYDRVKIFTYAFALMFVRAIVLSSRSVDIAGQIANGELTNILLKPVNFFKYWLTRDFASKLLNISFSFFEVAVLVLVLKPPVFLQPSTFYIIAFIASLVIAIFIFFNLLMLTNFVPFWAPELSWGAQFLVIAVVVEFLSGSYFPLDIFPTLVYQVLRYTPFPYLVFIPIKIYLGNFDFPLVLESLTLGVVWSFILWKVTNYVWRKGLLVYEGVGR